MKTFSEFLAEEDIKNTLDDAIESSRKRKGLNKNTLKKPKEYPKPEVFDIAKGKKK